MIEKSSVTIEDYLGVLFVMERDGVPVVGARIAELFGVSPPTVTNTLKRMARDGLITMDDEKGVVLTGVGMENAQAVTRRHMLSEWMLMRMLQVPWAKIHTEAHHFEHAISEDIEEQMRANLGNPVTCPHGNPLPGYEEIAQDWTALYSLSPRDVGILRRVHEIGENQPEFMEFMEANGLVPGVQVEVVGLLPFNQTMTVRVAAREVTIGYSIAKYIYIEKRPAESATAPG
jgi:DtxR family Mn-dependent transcriptional regulator